VVRLVTWARVALAFAALVATVSPPDGAHAAPPPPYQVWRIERVDAKPHRLKVSVRVSGAQPVSFFGNVNIRRSGTRYVPYRQGESAFGYGFFYEGGRRLAVPVGDVDEGPAHAATPTCGDLAPGACDLPAGPGPALTAEAGSVGWYTDRPWSVDFYAIVYGMRITGGPSFDRAYPGWRAVPVRNVSVTVVTKRQAEATGATNGSATVEHFHRATASSGRGYSVVQAILPCAGTSGPGAGSAHLTNSAGLDVPMDCDHPLYVAAAAHHTDWVLAGDVVGVQQDSFPYSRLIEVNFPA
jgi:hypothetical protein